MITACTAECIYKALQRAAPVLLEPIMQLEVSKVLMRVCMGVLSPILN